MSMTEWTEKCPICGDPYKRYAFYAGDQSACPDCIRKAEQKRTKRYDAEVEKAVERLTRSNAKVTGSPALSASPSGLTG